MASKPSCASVLAAQQQPSVTVKEDHIQACDFETREPQTEYHRLEEQDAATEAADEGTGEERGEGTSSPENPQLDPKSPRTAKTPQKVACLGLACARLCCTWSCKLALLLLFLKVCDVWGALGLGRSLWLPISPHQACQTCQDQLGCPKVLAQETDVRGGLAQCQKLCEATPGCEAVDWFDSTSWCNLYGEACSLPTADWDGAASYQMAVGCEMQNGTSGILVGGRCVLGVGLPKGALGLMLQEAPHLLTSPYSWACTIGVVGIYTYVTSPWLHARMEPTVTPLMKVLGPSLRRLWPMLAVPAAAFIAIRTSPSTRLGWLLLVALLLALAICPRCRGCLLSVLTCVMKPFVALVACVLSACFDTASIDLLEAATSWGRAVAVDGIVTTDGAAVAEGAAAADAEAGASSAAVMADGVTAANAAAAAEATAAKEAIATADIITTVSSACVLQ